MKLFKIILSFIILTVMSKGIYAANGSITQLGLRMRDVSNSIISDILNPMTHYDAGNFQISATPVYFEIPVLSAEHDDQRGDDLKGYGIGVTAGYALNDDFFLQVIYSYITTTGAINKYEDDMLAYRLDGPHTYNSLMAGIGYDFMDSDKWSLPLTAGLGITNYITDLDVTSTYYPPDLKVKSDSNVMDYYLGIAISRKFSVWDMFFKITPYIYYFQCDPIPYRFSSVSNPAYNFTENSMTGDGIVPGIRFVYLKDGLSISVSVNGLFSNYSNLYNNTFFEGLEMTTYSVTITYIL